MGCCHATSCAPERLLATKSYFGIEDLPVTLTARCKGQALEITVAGLDHESLLLALEAGFHQRGYWISDAALHINRGLFLGTFELNARKTKRDAEFNESSDITQRAFKCNCDVVDMVTLQTHNTVSASKSAANNYDFTEELRNMTIPTPSNQARPRTSQIVASVEHKVPADTVMELGKADERAANMGAVIRLMIVREWAPGLRIAMQKALEQSGLRIVMARLSVSKTTTMRTVKDTFWLAQALAEGGASLPSSFRTTRRSTLMAVELPPWLCSISFQINEALQDTQQNLPVDIINGEKIEEHLRTMADQLAYNETSLPAALCEAATKLDYHLAPSSWGLQFDGVKKFCGSGMTHSYSGKPVLQFATYYVNEKDAANCIEKHGWASSFATLMGALRASAVAEFLTEYDPQEHCLTIFKVFLNGVLPSGKGAGARVTAEQLPHMPAPGQHWNGCGALQKLRKIRLCDVVNWNTYCLMSMAGKEPSDGTEKWLCQEEAKCAGLTLAELLNNSACEIFARTVLGKMVLSILKAWREEQLGDFVVESVSIKYEAAVELILGEHRPLMNIDAFLKLNDASRMCEV